MTNNKVTKSLNAPMVIIPKRNVDYRGWFSETFHEQRLCHIGLTCRFVQDNQSSSKQAGTLRGLHFQLPPAAQAKLVSVLRGRVLDVAVDIRRGSPTYGKHIATELSAESGHRLYIPVGFAHLTRLIAAFAGMIRRLQISGPCKNADMRGGSLDARTFVKI